MILISNELKNIFLNSQFYLQYESRAGTLPEMESYMEKFPCVKIKWWGKFKSVNELNEY